MKPILYRINYGEVRTSDRPDERLLPWFTDRLIICFWTGNWMRAYLDKQLEGIKLEAESKGFRFFWIEDPNIAEFADLPIGENPAFTVNDEISYYLFDDQYTENVCLVRRLDDKHFVGWLKSDIVKSSTEICLPKELCDELGSPEDYRPATTWDEIEAASKEQIAPPPTRTGPDPNNDLHDHYFHQFSCQCKKCGTVDFYKFDKQPDFYNSMDAEMKCARCQKESHYVCSGDLGYYLEVESGEWELFGASIPSGTGYCEDCKPYYVSDVKNLEFKCDCGGVMR